MATKLKQKNVNQSVEFDPVELDEDVKVVLTLDVMDGKKTVRGIVRKGDMPEDGNLDDPADKVNIGRFKYSEKDSIVFLNLNTDGLKRETAVSIVETILDGGIGLVKQ